MNTKLLTLIVVGLVGLPMAAAASTIDNHQVVTGHTTYANMGGFDPDVAAIAGIAESKVVWFNGKTILSTLGDGYVYAVDSAVPCSPLKGFNYTFEDYSLSYIDPNDQPHIVAHYTYQCTSKLTDLDPVEYAMQQLLNESSRHHVWVTTTHEPILDKVQIEGDTACGTECDAGRRYNFALAVDTSFMKDGSREDDSETHLAGGGRNTDEINNGNSYCAEDGVQGDHVCNENYNPENEDGDHTHNTASVDLFFSKDDDKGKGANTSDGGSHPGTVDGCALDSYCSTATNGTYVDPTSSTA